MFSGMLVGKLQLFTRDEEKKKRWCTKPSARFPGFGIFYIAINNVVVVFTDKYFSCLVLGTRSFALSNQILRIFFFVLVYSIDKLTFHEDRDF